ncbi:MAG TPA: hypothetical protein VHI13_10890 [Candidatus Kapabacteria bacterium]|nr:hypothetical protein [Candidatus Kapabacteria bacterium]
MSKAKAEAGAGAEKLALYEKLVATIPEVERKGATIPYTSVNGNMFSYLSKDGVLALRLPAEARDAFIEKYNTRLCEQYGVVQKEYVEVPDALLKKTAELKKYFAQSHAYVSALKPKPTTRKKKE